MDSASDSAIAPRPGVDPLPAFALVWTTTAAGLALFRVGHHPLTTALAAAAAGLVFDLAGRLPGPWGRRWPRQPGRVDGPTPPASRPRSPESHRHLGCRAGHHGGPAAPIQHHQPEPIDDRG